MRKYSAIFRVQCEWDIGLGDDMFRHMYLAYEAAREALKNCDIQDNIESLIKDGLLTIEAIRLVESDD